MTDSKSYIMNAYRYNELKKAGEIKDELYKGHAIFLFPTRIVPRDAQPKLVDTAEAEQLKRERMNHATR